MQGASFQVTVHNPGKAPLRSVLNFDHNFIELASGVNTQAPVMIEVPAQGQESVTLRAKAGVAPMEVDIGLDAVPQALHLRLRDPNAPLPDPEEPNPDQPPPAQPNEPSDR